MVRSRHTSRSLLFGGLQLLLVALGLVGATSAGAVVTGSGAHGYGITPIGGAAESTLTSAYRSRVSGARAQVHRADEPPFGGSELENVENGPVMHKVTTHVVYWDPGSQFTSTTKGIVEGFFNDVAHDSGRATNTFAVAGQYTDATGHAAYDSTFGGAVVDAHAYPTTGNCTAPNEVDKGPFTACLFDGQLQSELTSFIAENGLPRGSQQLYFVLLPHNVATCLPEKIAGKQVCSNNFFCAYHSWIEPGSNEVIYADIPFSLLDTNFAKGCQADGFAPIQLPNGDIGTSNTETRFADVALKYMTHEYIEAVTDPLVNAPGETAWVDQFGEEIGDKCNSIPFTPEEEGEPGFDKHAFSPTLGGSGAAGTLFDQSIDGGHFYLQSEWDNAAEACLMKPLSLGAAAFTPTSGTAGTPVPLHASAADPYGAFEPTWSFGDGSEGVGASIAHTYAAPGEYTVTMTPKDALTDSTATAVTHTVKITEPSGGKEEVGKEEGKEEVGKAGGGGGGGTGGGGTGSGGGTSSGGGGTSSGGGSTSSTPAPTSGTLAFSTATATVAIAGSTISVSKKGAATITLSCAGSATCVGKLTVLVKTKGKHVRSVTLGTGSFSIAAGTKKAIVVKLSSAGRSLLKAGHGHLSAVMTVDKTSPAPDAKQTRDVLVSQKR